MLSFFTTTLSLVAALAPTVLGAPHIALRDVQTFAGKVKPKGYIVTLKEGASKDELLEDLGSSVTAVFNRILDDDALNSIRAHPGKFYSVFYLKSMLTILSLDVESIAQDGIVPSQPPSMLSYCDLFLWPSALLFDRSNAPWGLARISQTSSLGSSDTSDLTYKYNYDSSGGAGVDVYVVDTGIYTAHSTFGGRASWGKTFGGYANTDGNGHGTHVAGTVGGSQYGVAKAVNLIAVKVLSDSGSGYISDILSGFDWVIDAVESSGKPSIVSLSLGGSVSTTFDNGVVTLINAGIHVVVAAGNDGTNASGTSPAPVAAAITVGATTIADARASFSNYGSVIDIFAPGQYITSSWIGRTTATNNISGTSMATPHVSGLVAYLIGLNGNQSPAAMSTLIKSLGISGALTSIPSGTSNLLVNNGY
ncbi:serine protease [Desarmillaria tabescens]|uniref:Serine protease n=1 Tax=Armillaria tabescens TaxID=1929756 RepID=A0AA39K1K2_ARMTA|nr:serine protease [Desarmillaria tabescens]KAK0452830.1 serine protease [Desarmillaria tabescens]